MRSRAMLLALIAFVGSSDKLIRSQFGGAVASALEESSGSDRSNYDTAESFEFQAEVHRLMDIIINSLYKSKEIFLREVISNASDALDKLRFISVSEPSVLDEGDPELKIQISADKESRTITITDTGVGMTRAELIANLGTMAKSGTTNFVEALGETGDLSLIGQFGVGFYSVYLVADKVQVISKHAGDKQHIWESTADSTFSVREDPRGDTLERGTQIILHLKDDADEFLDEYRLSSLIHRYSEFITFPIYQLVETVAFDEDIGEKMDDEEEVNLDDEVDDEEVAEDELHIGGGSKTAMEWQRVNTNVAIWARNVKDVSDEEYQSFYKSLTRDNHDALTWTHFKAEGEVDFKSILYVPEVASFDQYTKYYELPASLKLYVRKVLIKDDFEDLLPRYLNFVRGVVDSDALPLNVSRETLQQQKVLQVIGKKLVRKTLDMLKKLADESKSSTEDQEGVADGEDTVAGKNDKYTVFWEQFGRNIKLGVIEDSANKSKLLKLLRFKSSKSEGKWMGLEDYVGRMKDWQKNIFYVSGENVAAVERSPFLEKMKLKDVEVIYITDPTDEYCMQHTSEFDGHRIMAASKEGVKFGDEDEKTMKALQKHYKEAYKPLTEYLKSLYSSKVSKIVLGKHVGRAPSLIVTPQYGYTANMERILKAQTFADEATAARFSSRTMELNPLHPIIHKMNKWVSEGDHAGEVEDMAWLLYDSAMAASGFTMEETDKFTDRIYRMLGQILEVQSMELLPEPDIEEDEEEEEEPADEEFDEDELFSQFQRMQADAAGFDFDEDDRDEL